MAAHATGTRVEDLTRKRRRARAPVTELLVSRAADGYWLQHCEGFRVDGSGGRIGIVEEVRTDPSDPGTVVLAVRAGLLGRRLLLFSASEVTHLVPQAQRLWLRTSASILGTSAPGPLPFRKKLSPEPCEPIREVRLRESRTQGRRRRR
jgi:hypothetical protein